jgi:hypothetical protein
MRCNTSNTIVQGRRVCKFWAKELFSHNTEMVGRVDSDTHENVYRRRHSPSLRFISRVFAKGTPVLVF